MKDVLAEAAASGWLIARSGMDDGDDSDGVGISVSASVGVGIERVYDIHP